MKKIKNSTGKKILVCDLKREHRAIKGDVELAVKRVLDKGWYILGKELEAFEKEFARYNGVAFAVGVASGTEALQISLSILGIGKGDEVITVPNTAIPTAMAIIATGATPKFVDIDPGSFNIDIKKLERSITKKTKAIIPVHLYGNPCDMKDILKIAKKHRLFIVEDACQAHGASLGKKKAGTFGDLGAFSFYPTKNLGCYGDGGAIVTDNKHLADKAKLLRNYGQSSRYRCDTIGMNSRLDEVQAAILRVKLNKLDAFIGRRREIAEKYNKYLKGVEEVRLPGQERGKKHSFHLFVIRCKDRDGLKKYLADRGVETQIHYPIPLHLQDAFAYLGYKPGDFSDVEKLSAQILSLPIFPRLKDREVIKICKYIRDYYGK
jgi:dTDP-4-amino-4,6-dideoxygalactose transaminase